MVLGQDRDENIVGPVVKRVKSQWINVYGFREMAVCGGLTVLGYI